MAQTNPGTADPLAQLRDIHLPGPIDSWPPAPGWWLLAIITAVVLLGITHSLLRRWQKNRYRREALLQLEAIHQDFRTDHDPRRYLTRYSELLKRVALSQFDRDRVAGLTGDDWAAFLNESANTDEFTLGAGQALIKDSYRPEPDPDINRLHQLGTYWIKQHRLGKFRGAGNA